MVVAEGAAKITTGKEQYGTTSSRPVYKRCVYESFNIVHELINSDHDSEIKIPAILSGDRKKGFSVGGVRRVR